MPLPFSRRATQTAPSFSRDFAGLKTLDHGVGPSIKFERASNATFFDANGTLQTAANDTPRFDHSGGSSLGLLIEESRTNSIRNSQAGGATSGVVGSGGVAPTNWAFGLNGAHGLTFEVVGTGAESGLAYIDVKLSGTPSANDAGQVLFEGITQIAASSGQTWTAAANVKLVAGSLTNVSCRLRLLSYGPTTTFIGSTELTFSPTTAALNTQRWSHTRTVSDAATSSVVSSVRIIYTNGNPIDLTLRIAAPQLEQGAFPTSYIPTTTAAATRAADSAVVTPISSFYNIQEGTLFSEGSLGLRNIGEAFASLTQTTFGRGMSAQPNTSIASGNVVFVYRNSATSPAINEAQDNATGINTATVQKFAVAHNSLGHVFGSTMGRTVVSDIADTVSPLVVCDRLLIGEQNTAGSVPKLNGHIRRIAYWPRRLSNSLLQQLTT
jgi:hypothetical protein